MTYRQGNPLAPQAPPRVEFVESLPFTRRLAGRLTDDDLDALQRHLVERPDAGAVVAGTGGCRKLRWGAEGRGKRGGVRVIYYHVTARGRLHLLTLYAKNEQSDLSPAQRDALRAVVSLLT